MNGKADTSLVATSSEGFLLFVKERKQDLEENEEEPDWEDEWDGLTIRQQSEYFARATGNPDIPMRSVSATKEEASPKAVTSPPPVSTSESPGASSPSTSALTGLKRKESDSSKPMWKIPKMKAKLKESVSASSTSSAKAKAEGPSSSTSKKAIAKKPQLPPKAMAKLKGSASKAKGGAKEGTDETPCPEFGEGWLRVSKGRAKEKKQADQYYLSPDGKKFNSRAKVLSHLGLREDPLPPSRDGGRGVKKLQKAKIASQKYNRSNLTSQQVKNKLLQAKERRKSKGEAAKERLRQALKVSNETMKRQKGEQHAAKSAVASTQQSGPSAKYPEPPGQLQLTDASLAPELMATWAFATSFSSALALSPFPPEALCSALQQTTDSTLLAELHTRLLRTLLKNCEYLREKLQGPAPLDMGLLLQQMPMPAAVTATSWQEVLRGVLWLLRDYIGEVSHLDAALEALHAHEYAEVEPHFKLVLLRTLSDLTLDLGEVPSSTDKNVLQPLRDILPANVDRLRQMLRDRNEKQRNIKNEVDAARHKAKERAAEDVRIETAASSAPSSNKGEAAANPSSALAPAPAESASDSGTDEDEPIAKVEARRAKRARRQNRSQATDALIKAIETRDVAELQNAIKLAEENGHEGYTADGRLWRTDELKAARKVLPEARMWQGLCKLSAKEKARITECIKRHRNAAIAFPTREEPLGEDCRRRKYWAFQHDPARLWVEAPSATNERGNSWLWAYYDTATLVTDLTNSLDESSCAEEARLKASLRDKLPFLTAEMAEDVAVNSDAGWMTIGHEFVGQRVTRVFDDYGIVSTGVITRWLPADGDADEGALFHVVHDGDGDEEDLEEHEAKDAIDLYLEQQSSDTLPEIVKRDFVYENKYEKRKAFRIFPSTLGVQGVRQELLDLEEALLPGLRRAGSSWDLSHDGSRMRWLLSCRGTTSVAELAQLLHSLEHAVRAIQVAPDVIERKPWRTEGHPFIGRSARRFFLSADGTQFASDGKITGWLPPEGDDEALWHMVHGDDADEEDLDVHEAEFAIANFVDGRTEQTEEEVKYAAKFAQQMEEPEAIESDPEIEDDDDDGDNDYQPNATSGLMNGIRDTRGGVAASRMMSARNSLVLNKRRLWITVESRERWQASLQAATHVSTVGICIVAFKQHCRWFGLLGDPKSDKKQSRADLDFQVHSWCHETALGTKQTYGTKGKKKKR